MKKILVLLLPLLLFISCSDRREVVYVDRDSAPAVEPMPQELYSNCYVPGRGFLGDDGFYYPRNTTYRCNGVVYYDGVRYTRPLNTLVGAMALGYYFGSSGPGYGNYGMYHTNVTNVKNVTVIKKGSSEYNKRSQRYSNIQSTRNKNKWVSKSEMKRRAAQSKRDKARHQAKMKAQQKKQKSNFFSRSSSKSKSVSKKSSSWGSSSRKSKRSSWSRSSSRSSFKSSRRSDVRLKNNIVELEDAVAKLKMINGVTYFYNGESKKQVGVIAQDVERVLPEAVEVNEDGFRSVRYDLIVPLLIQAVKEQQKQIDFLEKQLNNK